MRMPPSAFQAVEPGEWSPPRDLTLMTDRNRLVMPLRREAVRLMRRSLSGTARQRLRGLAEVRGFTFALNMAEKWAGTGQVWTVQKVWRAALAGQDEPEPPASSLQQAA